MDAENQKSLDTVITFMGAMGSGDMDGTTTKTGQATGAFTFALRAKVRDGQVMLWNWVEDSFAVSQAYHGR